MNTNLRPGDALLFVLADASTKVWEFRIIERVSTEAAQDRTLVTWKQPLATLPPRDAAAEVLAFAFRRRASVYGHNAPA